ncbi:MAG TPA: hypothetical protein VM032_05775 [Vicinamibacterales bacterium]|nr:hypothetical protein [Vicinamibacterales bacterium]
MAAFFTPTPDERRVLDELAREIADVQRTLVQNHPELTMPDRGAHQQQLAASKVTLSLADRLPPALEGLGIFQHGAAGGSHVGIGRISTGLGCPHAETDADFLGLMVAFRSGSGRRVDFITINDPTSPTDTPEEFVALLKATADAAGAHGLLASQARLLLSLARHAGLKAPAIALHVTEQTRRTVRSSSAYQQYWTGVVRAREVLGKFTFVPVGAVGDAGDDRSARHLTDDWRHRQAAGPLDFSLQWIPFVSDRETPLDDLTAAWRSEPVPVGTVTFPRVDPDSRDSRLTALLGSELGANPGNWVETPDAPAALPATRFTAARMLAYRESQKNRGALPDDRYASFFERGAIDQALATELERRDAAKRAAGHWVVR